MISPAQYIYCRYWQNQHISANGTLDLSMSGGVQASNNATGLYTQLNTLLSAPTNAQIPTDQKGATASMTTPLAINFNSIADVNSYANNFSAYGSDVVQALKTDMESCYGQADADVNVEKNMANTPIGLAEFKIQQQQEQNATQVNTLLDKYTKQYSDVMGGLTGTATPISVNGCVGSGVSATAQSSCLDDMRKNLEGLLAGTSANSTVNLTVSGTNPATAIPVQCMGLGPCITALQNVAHNIDTTRQQLTQYKGQYAMQANQTVQTYTQQLAQQWGPMSQGLHQQIQALNQQLVGLGVSDGIQLPSVQAEQLQQDADGLPKAPNSVLNLVGGQMNPPMLDVTSGQFDAPLGSLGQRKTDLDSEMQKFSHAQAILAAAPAMCKKTDVGNDVTLLQNDADILDSCAADEQWCSDHSSSLDTLQGVIDDISPSLSSDNSAIVGGLLDGANCSNSGAQTKKLQQRINASCGTPPSTNDPNYTTDLAEYKTQKDSPNCLAALTVQYNAPALPSKCNGLTRRLNKDLTSIKSDAGISSDTSGAQ